MTESPPRSRSPIHSISVAFCTHISYVFLLLVAHCLRSTDNKARGQLPVCKGGRDYSGQPAVEVLNELSEP